MNFLKGVLGSSCTIQIDLEGNEEREKLEIPSQDSKNVDKIPIYVANETIKGTIQIKLENNAKKIEHIGIKVSLIGTIKSNTGNSYDFLSVVKELEPAGELKESKSYSFEFENVDRQNESYNGINIFLNYYIKVSIIRNLTNITKQLEFWVRNYTNPPESNSNIKMEVGIEDCLHIEFEYNKSKYHLKDVIIGKIYFLLVRLKIKSMNISLIKRETTGTGLDMYNENKTLSKFEIMDGAPVKGEAIPVRLFLGGFDLTPTYKDVHSKFSVSYILNLVLVDEDDRRYFKQREINLWRKSDKNIRAFSKQFLEEENKPEN
jgi:vacuolar protein sorting-associated protein 26